MSKFIKGEAVLCWSPATESFFNGIVHNIDDKVLQILMLKNGKVYNFNADGSAIVATAKTNQRVFSVRSLNEEIKDELL